MSQHTQPLAAIAISGSPSPNSRSRILLEHTLAHLAAHGVGTSLLDLADLPADALLARRRDEGVDAAIQQATHANILLLGTPVYRATYTGQLKAFLDLFPQAALRGRVVGLFATGATPLHGLSVDHGLRPLVASLSGLSAADGVYITDSQFPDKANLPTELSQKLVGVAHELITLATALQTAYSH
ncbi:MAG: NAD(P)H-dependent oxidoreductase [Caldilineaceae bacterium]|nr:NAD(P)H-dependent oxidoreductase [Caldilineaceae bacterium]